MDPYKGDCGYDDLAAVEGDFGALRKVTDEEKRKLNMKVKE